MESIAGAVPEMTSSALDVTSPTLAMASLTKDVTSVIADETAARFGIYVVEKQ